jgi:hypothetical protein
MAELVQRLGHDGRIRHVRDRSYFAWRFANPLHEYRFLFSGDPHLAGYLVLQRSLAATPSGIRVRIVDFEAADADVRVALLVCALSAGRFPELMTWSAASSRDVRRLLTEAGFEPVDDQMTARGFPCLLIRPLRPSPRDGDWTLGGVNLLDLTNWDLRMVYSMVG